MIPVPDASVRGQGGGYEGVEAAAAGIGISGHELDDIGPADVISTMVLPIQYSNESLVLLLLLLLLPHAVTAAAAAAFGCRG